MSAMPAGFLAPCLWTPGILRGLLAPSQLTGARKTIPCKFVGTAFSEVPCFANFALTEFYEVHSCLVMCSALCYSAHTLPQDKSMLPSLRGQPMPREGAGRLPALLLDRG